MTDIDAIEKYRFCLNLVRYLMAQNPPFAEYQLQSLKKLLTLGDEVKKGNWVITLDIEKRYKIIHYSNQWTSYDHK